MNKIFVLYCEGFNDDTNSDWQHDIGWFSHKETAEAYIDLYNKSNDIHHHNDKIMEEITREANAMFPLEIPHTPKSFIQNLPTKEEQKRIHPDIFAQMKKTYLDAVELRQKENEEIKRICEENRKNIADEIERRKNERAAEFKTPMYKRIIHTEQRMYVREELIDIDPLAHETQLS